MAEELVNNKFRFYLERINDIIYDVDRNYIITFVNASDYKLRGFLPSEVIGKNIRSQIHPEDLAKYETEYISFLESFKKNPNLETPKYRLRLLRKDNTYFWVDTSLSLAIFDHDFAGFISVCRDVTKEVENYQKLFDTQEALQEMLRQKDSLFSVIAHDLRTPIHNFIYFSDFLFDKYDDLNDENREKLKRQMSNSAKRLNELLENLLTWSRFQRGQIIPNFQPVRMCEVINKSLYSLEDVAKAKDVSVNIDCPNDLIGKCDENMILAVFRNLIANAIKFSYRNSKIDILVETNHKYLITSITDYGKGIHPDLIPHLFEVGNKIGTIGTEGEPSSGVGLTICKDFLEVHKGKIEVQSVIEKGSTFKIYLPIEQTESNTL